MLKIALSGCNGRMGRVITDIVAQKEDMKVVAGFDLNAVKLADYPVYSDPLEFPGGCDVVIDFSNVSVTGHLLEYCRRTRTPVVICTTGHSAEQLALIEAASKEIPVFRSGNMSIGINLMMEVLKKCASVLGADFDVEIIEKHHNQKLDAPSGTALSAAKSAPRTRSASIPSAAAQSSVSTASFSPGAMRSSKSSTMQIPARSLRSGR